MAKENYAFISGQVCFKPKVYVGRDGIPLKATMLIKTIRRHYVRNNLAPINNNNMFDVIPVTTFNVDIINLCMKIVQGDMVEMRGVYTTKENTKKIFCEKCGEEIRTEGVTTFITPIYLRVVDKISSDKEPNGFNPSEAIDMLKDRAEVSNTIKIIGTLCREPEKSIGTRLVTTQYQIASNRRFRIKEDDPEARTDYPWVKSYGPQAESDAEVLHTGSVVYIDGLLQARKITKNRICPSCGHVNAEEDTAYEIVPYSVEYLLNCDLPEPTEKG